MAKPISAINMDPVISRSCSDSLFPVMTSGKANHSSDSFHPTGISTYWRKNISFRESLELANLLRALQKIAGHIGDNIGRIEYTGMSSTSDSSIRINPELVMGSYPIPSDRVDFVIGLVVHEAFHKIKWSDHVWKLLEPAMKKMSPIQQVIFQRVVFTGEDIYIDQISNQTVFGLYTEIARKKEMAALNREIPSKRSSLDELLLFWWARQFRCILNREQRPEYENLLFQLKQLSDEVFQTNNLFAGIAEKCRKRTLLFLDTWEQIKKPIQELFVYKKQLYWFHTLEIPLGKKSQPDSKIKITGLLPPQLVREIQTNLAMDTVDITPLIQSVVGFDNDTVAPMSRWDFSIPSHPVIDKRMVSRLKAIFQHYAARKKVTNRGLVSGRIDQRRLYRVPVTGRCFKEVEQIPSLDWSVLLLMDASGSMQGSKWKMVESTVANIHKALSGYSNRLSAFAYFEVNGICMISRLLKDNRLLSVPPSGQTASGQAIIAAGMMMPEKTKNKIMIHVTDGESNFGCDVSFGIDFCKQKKINLITLGCGYKNKKIMEEQYRHAIQFVDHFQQLPRAVERLFKWTFLYGNLQSFKSPSLKTTDGKGV